MHKTLLPVKMFILIFEIINKYLIINNKMNSYSSPLLSSNSILIANIKLLVDNFKNVLKWTVAKQFIRGLKKQA
jgi:hypothetical protein